MIFARYSKRRIAMMKKASVFFFVGCIALSIGWVSCKKEEKLNTPSSRLLGKWKKVRYATDDNANGVLDEWEMRPVEPGITNVIEFKKDSSGIERTTFSPDLDFRWFIGGDVSLMTIYSTGDTIAYKVVLVTSANLHISTKTKNGLAGYYYDTQK